MCSVGLLLFRPLLEKTCPQWFVNNKGPDQPAHPCSLISAVVIPLLECIISNGGSVVECLSGERGMQVRASSASLRCALSNTH